MIPSDLGLLHSINGLSAVPDGTAAVVSVLRPNLDDDEYSGGIWLVPLGERADPTRLTRGYRDTLPAYSPDGTWIAFLRAEQKGKPQLHILPVAGGEAICLTESKLGVTGFEWSPDSARLVATARIPEEGRYGTDEDVTAEAEAPRLITTNQYRRDGVGFLRDKRIHLLVVTVPVGDAEPAAAVQITDGDWDDESPRWSPDGSSIVFVSSRHAGADDDLRSSIWLCRPDGSEPRELLLPFFAVHEACFSADGSRLWFLAQDLGPDGIDFVARTTGLWSFPVDGSAVPTLHSSTEDDDLTGPLLLDGASQVLCHRLSRGAIEVVSFDGTTWTTVVDGPRQVGEVARTDAGVLVVAVADPVTTGDVVVVGESSPRTDFAAGLRAAGLSSPAELVVEGDYPVHGWVMKPPGDGPHPLLLFIHGGPYAQYGWVLLDEFQIAVTAGYAVAFCNPRGSAGYGYAHGRAIRQAMGGADAEDVLAFLAGVVADPAIDGDRVGVMGGSYGGYLTGLLTTRTDRFSAAIVERGFLDPTSFAGSSDIGWMFGHEYVGDDPIRSALQSPMAAIGRVTTPTLVIHSEADWRCPVEQGQRWYAHLKRQGVETELLLFPGEGHELTRSGRPRHRVARFEQVLRWWGKHLPV